MFSFGQIQLRRFFLSSVLSLLVFLLFFWIGSAHSAQITLAWDANTEPELAGYKIYYGLLSDQYSSSVDAGNRTSYTLSNLPDGKTYYFAATAYDRDGNESDFSNEAVLNAPPACTYSVSPASQSFAPEGGTGTVNVTTQPGCPWTALSNGSWLVVTSNGSVTGNGTVNYSALSNSSTSTRTATLTVAGQSVTITQNGTASYTITASARSNGSISPKGNVTVNSGASKTFTITPNANYKIVVVKVDGVSKGSITSYTFQNVTSSHSISAAFAILSYTITASAGSNGSISPKGTVTVNSGASKTFTIRPNANYKVADVKVDGGSKGAITSYTFKNVTSSHSISATFARR
jgi:fibronectin type 3 domain-containing protein